MSLKKEWIGSRNFVGLCERGKYRSSEAGGKTFEPQIAGILEGVPALGALDVTLSGHGQRSSGRITGIRKWTALVPILQLLNSCNS